MVSNNTWHEVWGDKKEKKRERKIDLSISEKYKFFQKLFFSFFYSTIEDQTDGNSLEKWSFEKIWTDLESYIYYKIVEIVIINIKLLFANKTTNYLRKNI